MKSASDSAEVAALDVRYATAVASAAVNGTSVVTADLETEVATKSRVVISRDSSEIYRLACSDNQLYATFHSLVEAGIRLPSDSKWDAKRPAIDGLLFTYYQKEVRFGALTLDERGLAHFGDCHLILKTEMIDFRTTAFTENTAAFVVKNSFEIPPGHRATWAQRGRLAVAKLASMLTLSTVSADLPAVLKSDGATSDDDAFVEAHVYGSISMRTVEQVSISNTATRAVRLPALREKLKKLGVPLVVV